MMMNSIINDDVMNVFPNLDDESAQIIIADPPYNIGKDFGDGKFSKELDTYLDWCEEWITQCLRILKSNGTLFIYGFSEILSFIRTRIPLELECRWLIWHYTNKQVPSLNFWQRSHESILAISKNKKERIFHRDEVREPYTDAFLNNAAGKVRKSTKGRFSSGKKETIYKAHKKGALPRDVIKIAALAGGAGIERIAYCKTCEEAVKGIGRREHQDQGHEVEVHETQKPLELCEKLIVSCRQDDGYLFVPFVGTGSECVSAKKLGVPFIGVEKNPIYVELANSRLIKFADDSDIEDKNSRQTNISDFSNVTTSSSEKGLIKRKPKSGDRNKSKKKMFASLVPHIKDRLTKHHNIYSGQCKAESWEEHCANALIKAGFGSDWSPDFNHEVGLDQTTDDGTRISNKGGKISDDLTELNISGSRLTKHETIEDKIKFLNIKKDDYVFCLATNKNEWEQGRKKYYFVVIDSKKLNYSDQEWNEMIGQRGKKKGKVTGWKCTSTGFDAKIVRSMSDQLWTTIRKSIFEEIYEIDFSPE